MDSPSVVFLVLDSLRRDRLSTYNSKIDFTESIEKFSEEAAVFENAVANAPWTLPSHASMFTGMYPWEHNATQRNLSLEVEKPLLAERFSEEGYSTACISTNAWLSRKFGLGKGFDLVDNLSSGGLSEKLSKIRRTMDEWLSSPGNEQLKRLIVRLGNSLFHYWNSGSQTEEVLERGKEFIAENDQFFLFLNLMDAHEPYFPPEEYREKHGAPSPREICQDPTDYHFGRKQPDFDAINRIYDASVDHVDDMLGEFFDYLRDTGRWEGTVLIVTSDHGQMLGENEEYGHQFSVAESLVSVPLMVKGAEDVDSQVELRELYDIVLNAAGIEPGYEAGTRFAKGSYEFPDMMRPRIPPKKWRDFYRRHKFARSLDGRVTRSENEEEEVETKFEGFSKELSDEEKRRLEEKLELIGKSEKGEDLEEHTDEIRRKLKDLGYG